MTDKVRDRIRQTAQVRRSFLSKAETETARLRELVQLAAATGQSETTLADDAGVTRMTIRAWLGK